jgi:hypothetical protein
MARNAPHQHEAELSGFDGPGEEAGSPLFAAVALQSLCGSEGRAAPRSAPAPPVCPDGFAMVRID